MHEPPATPPRFDLQVLGDLCLRNLHTGERIGEPRRKPLAVLAVLVTEAPNTVEREALLPLLWPELDLPRARRALAQTLYALRQELGEDEIVVGTTHLTVSPHLTSDLARFRARCSAGDREGCRREYGGPLLEGMQVRGGEAFDRWVAGHRARIDEQHEALLAPVARAAEASFSVPNPSTATPTSPLPGEPHVRSTSPSPARRWLTVSGAVVATLAVAAAALFMTRDQRPAERPAPDATEASRTPETIWQEISRDLEAQRSARLAATDSSKIGTVLILSARNLSMNAALDSLLPDLTFNLRATQRSEFAQPVSRTTTEQLERETAEWRLPATTDMHIARILATSGAGLAVQPILQARADTLVVSLYAYRSIAHTSAALPGNPNVEMNRLAGFTTASLNGREAIDRAGRAFYRFTRSLERCDPAFHVKAHDAPWCWRSRTQLDLVPGTVEQRQRDWFEQGRRRRAELESRALAGRSGP
jgi:anti-sigma-K factor RskA